MVTSLNQNQFTITPIQGMPTLLSPNTVSAIVDSSEAGTLVPGQAVKLVDVGGSGTLPSVIGVTADTDVVFGFIPYNIKNQVFIAGNTLEIMLPGSVMYMTSGAAIARGAKIEVDASAVKVITNAGVNPVSGFAYDKATGADQLIRVWVLSPYTSPFTIADIAGLQAALDAIEATAEGSVQNLVNVVTLAQVNAGKTLVPVPTGKKAIVSGFVARSNGAFGALTSINLKVGTAVVANLAQAQLTNGAILFPGESGVTLGAAFGIAGGDGDDIVVDKTGSSGTTATDVTFTVTYNLIDA